MRAAGGGDGDGVRAGESAAAPPGGHRHGGRHQKWRMSGPRADPTAPTNAAAAAAANMSWPPVTAVSDALGVTLTGERAGVTEAAAADGGTTAALLSGLAAAVAGGASLAVPAASDRPAALTAVASATGAYAAPNPWVRGDMVPRGGVAATPPPRPSSCPCRRPPTARRRGCRSRRRGRPCRRRCSSLARGGGGRPARRRPPRGIRQSLCRRGGGELSRLDMVGGAPAAVVAAAAAPGGAAAGAHPAELTPTAMGRSLLSADGGDGISGGGQVRHGGNRRVGPWRNPPAHPVAVSPPPAARTPPPDVSTAAESVSPATHDTKDQPKGLNHAR